MDTTKAVMMLGMYYSPFSTKKKNQKLFVKVAVKIEQIFLVQPTGLFIYKTTLKATAAVNLALLSIRAESRKEGELFKDCYFNENAQLAKF